MIVRMDTTRLDELTALFLKVYSEPPWNDEWPNFHTASTYLREFCDNPHFLGYMIEDNEHVIGASFGHTKTWWQGKEYCIDEFFIDTDSQGSGRGSRLMSFIKSDLSKQGVTAITLLTERGFPAEKFYVKNGFIIKDGTVFMVANELTL